MEADELERRCLQAYFDAHRRHEAMRRLLRYEDSKLLRHLSLGGKRLLEMGCGSLPLALALMEDGATYVGSDLSEFGLGLAETLAPGGRFVACDAVKPPFLPGQFDVIFMKNLLHHLGEPAACLRAARELLAPGGLLVVLEPNSKCIGANVAKALFRLLGIQLETSPYGQLKVEQLRAAFRAAALDEIEAEYSGILAFPLAVDYGARRLLPMWGWLWRVLIALDRAFSILLSKPAWLGAMFGFKAIFHLQRSEK